MRARAISPLLDPQTLLVTGYYAPYTSDRCRLELVSSILDKGSGQTCMQGGMLQAG